MSNYLICATPRSGSYLLCDSLASTGVAGHPTEYLSPSYRATWSKRWGTATYAGYLERALVEGATPNGVFGAKVHPVQLDDFCRRMGAAPGAGPEVRRKLLDEVIPRLEFVWLRRRDKLRQGISYAKALQSHQWWDAEEDPAPTDAARPEALQFDRVLLERCVTQMHLEEGRWAEFFVGNGICPLEVVYEDLAEDPATSAVRVLAHLGVALPAGFAFPAPRLRRQADATSEAWARRLTELSVTSPAIRMARRDERPAVTPTAGRPLEAVLGKRRWWRVAGPFAHVRAFDVFAPDVYRAMREQYRRWLAAGRFKRGIPGYDVTALALRPSDAGPFGVLLSRAWHDMLAAVVGVEATGEVNATLHHHAVGSASGRPHNDLNPGFFAETDRDGDGIVVADNARCNYRTGRADPGVEVIERVRAVAAILYLGEPGAAHGPGGQTGLYRNGSDPIDRPAVSAHPVPNSLVAFECTPFSHHGYVTNTAVERPSLVMWLHRPRTEAIRRWGEGSIVGWK